MKRTNGLWLFAVRGRVDSSLNSRRRWANAAFIMAAPISSAPGARRSGQLGHYNTSANATPAMTMRQSPLAALHRGQYPNPTLGARSWHVHSMARHTRSGVVGMPTQCGLDHLWPTCRGPTTGGNANGSGAKRLDAAPAYLGTSPSPANPTSRSRSPKGTNNP